MKAKASWRDILCCLAILTAAPLQGEAAGQTLGGNQTNTRLPQQATSTAALQAVQRQQQEVQQQGPLLDSRAQTGSKERGNTAEQPDTAQQEQQGHAPTHGHGNDGQDGALKLLNVAHQAEHAQGQAELVQLPQLEPGTAQRGRLTEDVPALHQTTGPRAAGSLAQQLQQTRQHQQDSGRGTAGEFHAARRKMHTTAKTAALMDGDLDDPQLVDYTTTAPFDLSIGEPQIIQSLMPSPGAKLAALNGRTVYNYPLLQFNISGLSVKYNPPNAAEVPQDGMLTDIIIRFGGPSVLPITAAKLEIICQAIQETMVPLVGPVTFVTFEEFLPTEQDVNEKDPYADFLVRLYIRIDAAREQELIASSQGAQVGDDMQDVFINFLAFVNRMTVLGLKGSVRMVGLTQIAGTFVASQYPLRPIERYDLQLDVTELSTMPVNASCVTAILSCLRNRGLGLFMTNVDMLSETAPPPGTATAQLTLRVTVVGCNLNATLAPCPYSPQLVLRELLTGEAFQEGLRKKGLMLSVNVTSINPSPSLIPPVKVAGAVSAGAGTNLSVVPWYLDRLDQRTLPLDGQYAADNLGTGVNIYLMSSGIRASHHEFDHVGSSTSGSRIKPAWGYNGSDPLVDCPDYIPWYGFGTFAASLMAGKTLGVAKNATVYSVRFRDKCLWMSPTIWGPGGLPSAMDAVLSNLEQPAIMMIDTWWMPTRLAYVDPAYVASAINQRLDAAAARNITVIAPASVGIGPGPCNNVIAAHPHVIAVGSLNANDQRSINSPVDLGNTSCIDLWAPGGGLGHTLVGAAASGDSAYIGIIPRGDAAPYLVAGLAAQYLAQHPQATSAQVKAALAARATAGILTDVGDSPNLLVFTNLMEQRAVQPPTAPSTVSDPVAPLATSAATASLAAGTLAGMVVGSIAGAVLLAAALGVIILRRRSPQQGGGAFSKGSSFGSGTHSGGLDFEISPDDIRICTRPDGSEWELGVGQFGRVTKAIKNDVQVVAVKTLRTSSLVDAGHQEDFLREIAMMKFVSRDRNIVQYYGACIQCERLMLVTEYMEGGDLRRALADDLEAGSLRWHQNGKRIALDIARGVSFLHANNVIHRDLKSKNILLSADGCAKISDVGMAKMMTDGSYTHGTAAGTFAWAAPELLVGGRCNERVDIFSLGVVLWEVVTHEAPLRGEMRAPKVPEECPQELADLISVCMSQDPAARPSAKEVYARLQACPHPLCLEVLEPEPEPAPARTSKDRSRINDDSAEAFSLPSGKPPSEGSMAGGRAHEPLAGMTLLSAAGPASGESVDLTNSERLRRLFKVPSTPVDWRQAYGGFM